MTNVNTTEDSRSNDEEALSYILTWLKARSAHYPHGDGRSIEPFGFDLYRDLIQSKLNSAPIDPLDSRIIAEKVPLLNAIWNLCLRGILRPSAIVSTGSNTGIATGNSFALTGYGRQWLHNTDINDAVPMEYGRFSQLLARHAPRFGPGYYGRSQEAINCYQAHVNSRPELYHLMHPRCSTHVRPR